MAKLRAEVMLQVLDSEKQTVAKPYKSTIVKDTNILRRGEEFSFSSSKNKQEEGVPLIPGSWRAQVVDIIWVEIIDL